MKIKFNVVNEIPEKARQLEDGLAVVDNEFDEKGITDIYTVSNTGVIYEFKLSELNNTPGNLIHFTDLIKGIFVSIAMEHVDGIEEHKTDIITTLKIILAKYDHDNISTSEDDESMFKLVDEGIDHENKIFFSLTNGQTLYVDANNFNWLDYATHINEMQASVNVFINMIRLLTTTETIKIGNINANGENEMIDTPTIEAVKNEVNHFMTQHNLKIDYSMFDTPFTTERERLIVRLVDMITITKEFMLVAASIGAQKSVIDYYEHQKKQAEENNKSEEET